MVLARETNLTGIFAGALIAALFAAGEAFAAEFQPAAHEVWAGTYKCGAMERDPAQWPAYSASIRLVIDNGTARILKESARIRVTMTGEVGDDGMLKLEGAGVWKDGGDARWRYRFDGRFEGTRFQAQGAMLSASLATKLRDCSMALTRVQASGGPAQQAARPSPEAAKRSQALGQPIARTRARAPAAPKASPQAAEQTPAPEAAAKAAPVPSAADAKAGGERELDFTKGNDAAVIEGNVTRGMPDRYAIVAKKGQTLSATLSSDGGARLDVYEPGVTMDAQKDGLIVVGSRLEGTPDGAQVQAELPTDGTYLLLVRALRDQAIYTLDIGVRSAGASGQGAKAAPGAKSEGIAAESGLGRKTGWLALFLALAAVGAGMVIYSKRDRRLFKPR